MGILDQVFDRDDEEDEKKAGVSNVPGGAASTACAPRPASTPTTSAASGGDRTYTVQAGDSLSKIARRAYGGAAQWKRIHEANHDPIANPDLIHPGLTLRLS